MTTDELIETLERLEKEATPGPWSYNGSSIEADVLADNSYSPDVASYVYARNGALIVSLRNHLPALISANQRLRERAVSARASIMSAGVRIEHAGLRFDQVDGHKEGRSLLISAMEAATEAYETLGAALQPQGEK